MTTQTADSIIASFPNEKISSSDEEPTCNLIKIREKELIENITSIRSELGEGQHRYLGLILTTKYHTITVFYSSCQSRTYSKVSRITNTTTNCLNKCYTQKQIKIIERAGTS